MNKKTPYFIVVLLFFVYSLPAQEVRKTPTGLGIDAGIGYNMFVLHGKTMAGNDSTVFLNRFWMQPCLRLHYDIKIKDFGSGKTILKVKTFLGYYTFGGKAKVSDIGEYDIVSLSSVEAGAGLSFDFIEMVQISPLIKGQYVFTASERYIRETAKPATDIKDQTNLFSYNFGLQLRFKYRYFTVAAEGWYGLADIHKDKNKTAKENNFRILLGYEF